MTIISPGKMNMISPFDRFHHHIPYGSSFGLPFDIFTLDSVANNMLSSFTDTDNSIIQLRTF